MARCAAISPWWLRIDSCRSILLRLPSQVQHQCWTTELHTTATMTAMERLTRQLTLTRRITQRRTRIRRSNNRTQRRTRFMMTSGERSSPLAASRRTLPAPLTKTTMVAPVLRRQITSLTSEERRSSGPNLQVCPQTISLSMSVNTTIVTTIHRAILTWSMSTILLSLDAWMKSNPLMQVVPANSSEEDSFGIATKVISVKRQ